MALEPNATGTLLTLRQRHPTRAARGDVVEKHGATKVRKQALAKLRLMAGRTWLEQGRGPITA